MARTRLGLFGGTFDPPHLGHVAAVRAAVASGRYDVVLVTVAGDPYLKRERESLSAPAIRLAMAHAAFGDIDSVDVSEREIGRPGPTYTVDTVRELRAEGYAVELLVGTDAANSLPTWRDATELCDIVTVGVFPRPHTVLTLDAPWRVVEIPMAPVDLSSTGIRGENLDMSALAALLPAGVIPLYLETQG